MNLGAWKKVLLFGMFGAAGCLAGWAVGEVYLLAVHAATDTGPSLISSQRPPSADPPPPPLEFRDRLEAKGAKSGDVQISLIWFNVNDLDLHCIDPNGFEIYYRNRRSPSGGELDVDANATAFTATPVENIYWPVGGAPQGTYRVYVDFFRYRPEEGAPDTTSYKVNVLHGGKRKEFEGTIKYDSGGNNKRLIYEFALSPRAEVYAAGDLSLDRGSTIRLPVAVRRVFYKGKLDLSAENLPEGVTAAKVTISEGKDDGILELKASTSAAEGKKSIKIVASGSDVMGSFDTELTVKLPAFSFLGAILMGVWTALLAVGLCLALLAGQNRYLNRPLFAAGRITMATVIVGAICAGFSSGSVGQALFSILLSIGVGGVGFVIGWMLLGALLGWGVSFFVANLDKQKASLAGLAGGLLGAVSYFLGSQVGDAIGRFAGAAALGFCIGLVVAIVEAAFRRAWLEVRFGERETISVNLGPEPVKVGGDARMCTVWARGAADVALRFFIRNNQVVCEDVPTRTATIVGEGYTRTAGTVTLTVRTGSGAAPLQAASPPVAPLPAAKPPLATPSAAKTHMVPAMPLTAPPAAKPTPTGDDDLPMPMSPTTSARPKVASILDDDGYLPPIAKPPVTKPSMPAVSAKPPVPASPKPTVSAPVPAPVATKPPAPTALPPRPAAPGGGLTPPVRPEQSSAPAGEADGCPTCKRKAPGRPGARYCMFCDKSY